ncbi:MAG TPA: HGGxSTG domain-containing protein [Chloroflexota bacterium]|nr:HGGxSTG domain-containing protein [Chloroflexota bacterium]
MTGTVGWLVCRAKKSDGTPCKAPVIRGARVCRSHGGSTRHVKDAAAKRLEELVLPSISKLRTLMLRGETHSVQLKAATEILDRAGIVATQNVEVDNQVTVTVSYADVVQEALKVVHPERTIDVTYSLPESNGHAVNGDADVPGHTP